MAKIRKIKILINAPNYKKPYLGGVANHYYGLRPYWTENVRYNIVGSRTGKSGKGKYLLPFDMLKFFLKLICFDPACVILNPSLASNAIRRDLVFLRLCKLMHKKAIVFFHGFNPEYANGMDGKTFCKDFKGTDAFIVLSQNAKSYLIRWGIKSPVHISTTKVDDRMLDDFHIDTRQGLIRNILFLTRIEKEKGIFEALNIFKSLSDIYPSLKFTVVGSGSMLDEAKLYSQKMQIPNITFTGKLTGQDLIDAYKTADMYLFTSYHEGMPTTVLEAMAFGLPVITRPVGGVVDFFENGRMGELINSFSPADYAMSISRYISDYQLSKETSIYNYNYAIQHFLASKVSRSIENICRSIVK